MMLGKRAEKTVDALATKTSKPGGWEFTFRWPPAARLEPLTLFLKAADLKARDPEGKSLLTGKLRHLGLLELERASESIEFLPPGPKEGQIMTSDLIHFVWRYVTSGVAECPLDISPMDCYLALDFFGFPALEIDIKVKEDDPHRMTKMTSFSIFLKTQKAIPLWIERVKTVVEETSANIASQCGMGSKGAHFVLGPSFNTGSFYGPDDLLLHHYEVMLEPGVQCHRLKMGPKGGNRDHGQYTTYQLLSADTTVARDAKEKVLAGVNAVKGLNARWKNKYLIVADEGSMNMHSYRYKDCDVLEVELETEAESGEEGKRGIVSLKTKFDADSSFFGVFDLDIEYNGEESIKVGRNGILYKGVTITPLDVMVDRVPDGDQLTFSAFIDKQTSVWAPGQVGLSEHLEVQFVAAGSQVRGSFQRTGEGPLRVQGKRREIEGDEIVDDDSDMSD